MYKETNNRIFLNLLKWILKYVFVLFCFWLTKQKERRYKSELNVLNLS